jgi:uncharacterized protein (DUF58 family)
MHVTRRYWASVGLAGLLAAAAIGLAQPILVAGAAGLAAWLLSHQWLFVRTAQQLQADLQITQRVTRTRVGVDDPVTANLTITRPTRLRSPITVTVAAGVPLGATGATPAARKCTLTPTESGAATTFTVEWPVAGQATFDSPTVTVTDDHGLFQTSFAGTTPASPTVTVQPERPRALHVGTGGDPIQTVFGEHPGAKQVTGLDPATVREYAPGDPLRQIDWNATARSDDLYVRTFTEQTEHETALFIDHRAPMGTGTPGETKLAYARQVALSVLDHAQAHGDPVGLYAVGDGGVTVRQPSTSTGSAYATLRTALHDLTPTQAAETEPASGDSTTADVTDTSSATTGAGVPGAAASVTPRDARQAADALTRETSAFATRLRPFYSARQTYVERIATTPLYATARAYLTTGGGTGHNRTPDRTVILTDATNQAEVREAVNVARRYSDYVFVFLTPTVLFEPNGLADVDRAYTLYADFETFRQQLARLDDVSAFEVAPGERLATLQTTTPSTVRSRGE